MAKSDHFECAVIGDWHLAFTTATCLAMLGKRVVLVKPERTAQGAAHGTEFPQPPVTEPGMPEAIAEAVSKGKLSYREGLDTSAGWSADLVWLAIDTPVDEFDRPDVSPLEGAAEKISASGFGKSAFVISSQIPLGFSRRLAQQHDLKIAYVPENLRLGKGIDTFMKADRTVIGADDSEVQKKVRALLDGVQTDYFFCDLPTAEMVKHATNAFLATSISFANELARIGEQMGVDNVQVAQALKLDKRIGKQAYVAPGLGFAGGTLPRDLRVLQSLGKNGQVPTPLIDAVLEVNESTAHAIVDSMRLYLEGRLEGKTALILGYTYKAETDTLRRSPALELAHLLKKYGVKVQGYDPVMNGRDLSELRADQGGPVEHFDSIPDPRISADVVFVMTTRPQFLDFDWSAIAKRDARPFQLLVDSRSYLPAEKILKSGFAYKSLWQPVRMPR